MVATGESGRKDTYDQVGVALCALFAGAELSDTEKGLVLMCALCPLFENREDLLAYVEKASKILEGGWATDGE